MKPSALSSVGAVLAVLAAPAFSAELFTLTRFTAPASITSTDHAGNGISVYFLNSGVESMQIDCSPPGTSIPLLSYSVTTVGDPDTQSVFQFNEQFTLSVLLTSYPGGSTYTLVLTGTVTGSASRNRSNLNIDLALAPPGHPEAQTFNIGETNFTVSNIQASPPPIVNDTQNPGSLYAFFVTKELATSIASVEIVPAAVQVGGGSIGTVTLDKPAPAPGVLVRLLLPIRPSYERPPTVWVPGGATSAAFPVVALLNGATVVGAEYNGTFASTALDITTTDPCTPADVDRNGVVELPDVVRSLRIVAGLDVIPG